MLFRSVRSVVDEYAHEHVECHLVVLAGAFHCECVVDGADFILHLLDFEVRRVVTECAEYVWHFVDRDRVSQDAGLFGLLSVHILVCFGPFLVTLALGCIPQLCVVKLVLHVLLQVDITDHLYQFFFLSLLNKSICYSELSFNRFFVQLPDFD